MRDEAVDVMPQALELRKSNACAWWPLVLADGHVSEVARWVRARGLTSDGEPAYPREQEYLVLARVLLAEHHAESALEMLERWRELAGAQGRVGSVITLRVLAALAHAARGDEPVALAVLAEALTIAAPEGYIRVFVDKGSPLATLLRTLMVGRRLEQLVGAGAVPRKFLTRLAASFDRHGIPVLPAARRGAVTVPGLVEPLSARERDVLALLAAGHPNRPIADDLVITLDTVKPTSATCSTSWVWPTAPKRSRAPARSGFCPDGVEVRGGVSRKSHPACTLVGRARGLACPSVVEVMYECAGCRDTGTLRGELPSSDAAEVTRRDIRLYERRRMHYLETGEAHGGPPVVLVHGLAGDSTTWVELLALLGRHAHVLAPDLLGAGASAKPVSGDYSIAAHAATLRDLLRELGHYSAIVVGHSFGGGVAMSFAYQFPERTEGIGLISSGGFGSELTIALRAATLPGATIVPAMLSSLGTRWLHGLVRLVAVRAGIPPGDVEGFRRALLALSDPNARYAFLRTVRGVVTWSGQRLSAIDQLGVLSGLPALLLAGRRDSCIPYQHTVAAHQHLPRSRLEILDTGHFPHLEQPGLVADMIADFLAHDLGQRGPRGHATLAHLDEHLAG